MKKFLLVLMSLFICCLSFANDGYFSFAGGNLTVDGKESSIRMQEETIHIRFEDDFYEVTVDFTFYNPGKEKTLSVAFPVLMEGEVSGVTAQIYDFQCWTDGRKEKFDCKPIIHQFKKEVLFQNAYVRKIKFKKQGYTTTKVQYKCSYGAYVMNSSGEYLFGTGKTWNGNIGKMVIQIENNLFEKRFDTVFMNDEDISKDFKRISETLYETVKYDVEPNDLKDKIQFLLADTSEVSIYTFPKKFFYMDRLVYEDDVFWLNKKQLRLVRNLIYAWHGYEFSSKDINDYLRKSQENQEWRRPYEINPNFSENDLSDIEKINIKFLLEQEKKWSY